MAYNQRIPAHLVYQEFHRLHAGLLEVGSGLGVHRRQRRPRRRQRRCFRSGPRERALCHEQGAAPTFLTLHSYRTRAFR